MEENNSGHDEEVTEEGPFMPCNENIPTDIAMQTVTLRTASRVLQSYHVSAYQWCPDAACVRASDIDETLGGLRRLLARDKKSKSSMMYRKS